MLDATFSALADPTRRTILEQLARGNRSVGELGASFDISGPAISRHLRVLQSAGLIQNDRLGKGRVCTLVPSPLQEATQWMDFQSRFWTGSLDRLEQFVRTKND